jgi:hypothetical protein
MGRSQRNLELAEEVRCPRREGGPVTTLLHASSFPCVCKANPCATNSSPHPVNPCHQIPLQEYLIVVQVVAADSERMPTGPTPPPRTVTTSSAKCSVVAIGYSEVSNKKAIASISTLSHISPLFSVRSTDRKKTLYLCGTSLPPLPLALLERALPGLRLICNVQVRLLPQSLVVITRFTV